MAGIAALAVAYVLSQFYRSFLAVLTPALSTDLGMTKADLSMASGIWFAVFALAQFAVGVSLDRFGPRITASAMLGIFGGAGAFLFTVAMAPWMVIAAMALIGLGCAPVLMSMLFIFARTYSAARFAVLASWTIAFGTAGNVIGAAPMAAAVEMVGWRNAMAVLGLVTVLVAVVIALAARDPARPVTREGQRTGLSGYVDLLRMRVLWPIIPLAAINAAPMNGIRGLWAGPYLEDVYGLDALSIGEVTTFMALAMVAGSFLYGPLDTIFRTRKWVAIAGTTITLVTLVFLAMNPVQEVFFVTVIFIVIGLSGSGFGLIMAHARAFFPDHLTGRGVTLMNFFSIGGVGVMQFATGAVFTARSVPGDPVSGYVALFSFYAIMVGLTLAIYLFSRDARPETTR